MPPAARHAVLRLRRRAALDASAWQVGRSAEFAGVEGPGGAVLEVDFYVFSFCAHS